jgi:hypothetical protein
MEPKHKSRALEPTSILTSCKWESKHDVLFCCKNHRNTQPRDREKGPSPKGAPLNILGRTVIDKMNTAISASQGLQHAMMVIQAESLTGKIVLNV